MNTVVVLICLGAFLFVLQTIYFMSCSRWLATSKRKCDKEWATFETEKSRLLQLHAQVKKEMIEAKKTSTETLHKLQFLGSEAYAGWADVTKKISDLLAEVDSHSKTALDRHLSQLNLAKMAVEKLTSDARHTHDHLAETNQRAETLLKLFDSGLPTEEILKDLQAQKYTEAKRMLAQGHDASAIAKNLGMSLGEVITLSAFP